MCVVSSVFQRERAGEGRRAAEREKEKENVS